LLAMLGQSSDSLSSSSVLENAGAGHGIVANDHFDRFVRASTFMATMIATLTRGRAAGDP